MRRLGILLLLFLTASGVEAVSIESVIYDIELLNDRMEGFCLIKGEDVSNIGFSSSFWKIGIVKQEKDMVVLELSRNVSDNSGNNIEIPLLVFPYKVEKTMVGVSSRKKFVWENKDVYFDVYSVQGDAVLARSDVKEVQIKMLDEQFSYLEDFSGLNHPENRIYLGVISEEEEIILKGYRGDDYGYIHGLGVIIICALLFFGLYLASKRLAPKEEGKINEKTGVKKERVKKEEMKVKRARWERYLDELEGDKLLVYKEILNENGEICQRDLPERTGFSKAKVSRILDKLEEKNLVRRQSYGMTNLVVLK